MGLGLRFSPLNYSSRNNAFDFGGASINGLGDAGVHANMYVDKLNGRDVNTGLGLKSAKSSIQAAVNLANSPTYALKNVDIHIVGGRYSETVNVSRAGTGLGATAMLWTAGGENIGYIGTIRIIGHGNVFWRSPITATQPTLSVGRPNVELHNIACIRSNTTETVTKTNWTSGEGQTPNHVGMPTILFDGEYNADTILYGAAANCKVVNCRVNAGGARGAILNYGCNWVSVHNTLMEYGAEYNLAITGSQKGSPAENLIENCRFQRGTAADILHGNNIITWVKNCEFPSVTITKYMAPISPGGASQLCMISDCSLGQPDIAELVPNAGWIASGIRNAGAGTANDALLGDSDLAS